MRYASLSPWKPIKPALGVLAALLWSGHALAQQQPLSVIDWVHRHSEPEPVVVTPLPDPGTAPGARVPPEVDVTPLEQETWRTVGLVPASVTNLPRTLWTGSDPDALGRLITRLPDLRVPAGQALLYRLLLTESFGPGNDLMARDSFTLARAGALVRAGALDPARALIEQAGATRDAAHFAAWLDVALLTGDEDLACDSLNSMPRLAPTAGHRIFCAVRGGDWRTAALLFDTGRALGAVPLAQTGLLERFLDPDLFEGDPALVPPAVITPLLFRLHESVGEPLPTRFLPRAYAVADLRDLSGWKSQLEAAERLARAGTLADNQLLGLYTAREPAASGGIWDRVAAVQKFETALSGGDAAEISATLVNAWEAVRPAGLEVPFAGLFADRLTSAELTAEAARIARTLGLLSLDYREAARHPGTEPLYAAIAAGQPGDASGWSLSAMAISDAFAGKGVRTDLTALAAREQLGEALLRCLVLLEQGAAGDPAALTGALATLRALGQEDTARRAALQILLLDRYS
ncbi:hypothetical protein [Roseobacter ponti]|uniref:hypothetical protein n=1 Tax=Roseobacter ponti TaxID=1891787 RepID=UPI001FE6B28B|nr:hypothetical protein [Roseobacter ponti]